MCEQRNEVGSCRCVPEYFGDPYVECRPECVSNSECPSNRACINNICCDPCPGTCGELGFCNVVNHAPICSCPEGYIGNPLVACALPPGENSFHTKRYFFASFTTSMIARAVGIFRFFHIFFCPIKITNICNIFSSIYFDVLKQTFVDFVSLQRSIFLSLG